MEGTVLVDGTEYDKESTMYNRFMDNMKPGIIAMVRSVGDIQKALQFSRQHKLRVTIRSSGHDYSGRSTWTNSLNINLAEMNGIMTNLSSTRNPSGEVKVFSGATMMEVYQQVNAVDRIVVGGSAHTVAAGGYTLGGGHSPVSQTYGYAVDNLLEVKVVLADASVATCTPTQTLIEYINGSTATHSNGDLFWALSGGGGGTFGVAVYFVYKLHPSSPMVLINGTIALRVLNGDQVADDRTERVLNAVHELVKTLPSSYGGYFIYSNHPFDYSIFKLQGVVTLFINKLGTWQDEDNALWENMFGVFDELSSPYTLRNFSSFLEYEVNAVDEPQTRTVLASSFLQPSGIGPSLTNFMNDQMFTKFKGPDYLVWMGCTGVILGGKTTEPSTTATPLHPGYRSAAANLVCGPSMVEPNDPNYPPNANTIIEGYAIRLGVDMASLGEGMYFNEPTLNTNMWKEKFWGSNYPRLLEIKAKYDRENFFTCKACVGSEFDDKGSSDACATALPSYVILVLSALILVRNMM